MDEPEVPDRDELTQEQLDALIARARDGDAAAMAAVSAWLDAHPQAWREGGDLATVAERAWIARACGPDPVQREAIVRHAADLTRRLAGPDPGPIVALLARRAAICWLQVHHADAVAADHAAAPPPVGRFLMERQDRAHRRYLSALAELARVRKLIGQDTATSDEAEHRPAARLATPRLSVFGA